jgi:hypothetical protein
VQPSAHLEGGIQGRVVLPWPHLALDEAYVAEQPVVVEVWIEKSTMDDVLLPICERYDVSLQTGVGQIGLEAPRLLVERAAEDGRPHVVLYISDFDSQGENMPVAVARKIEWMLRTHGADARIQLYPLALTKEQVERYTLPLLVSKDPDAARRLWEQEHKGTVELDALEALHPGELGRIVDEAVRCFRDPDLQERVDAAEQEALLALAAAERQARAEHAAAMTMAEQRLQEAWQAAQEASTWLARRLAELRPALPAVPEWDDYAGLDEEPLYDSERDYLYQNEYYQERKRKDEDAT